MAANDFINFPKALRARDAEHLARIQQRDVDGGWALLSTEVWFTEHQPMFLTQGYLLRPRFRPGWIPSWRGTDIIPNFCEDSIENLHSQGIDARRLSDGKAVFLKRVRRTSSEPAIGQFLSSLSSNPRNHCVPMFDYFHDSADPELGFIVMPLLRHFNDPPFFSVAEVVDFMKQTLEGIAFMHEHGVAHRDLSDLNIMLDGTPLYPQGFHPTFQHKLPSGAFTAPYIRRSDVPSVNYYITDFGLSTRFEDPSERPLVVGLDAQDKEVPELSDSVPYDPFFVDIFTLGNLYKRHFVNVYSNMSFISSLVDAMTHQNPNRRPTADEAIERLEVLVSQQRGSALRWHLQTHDDKPSRRISRTIHSVVREVQFLLKKMTSQPLARLAWLLGVPGSILLALYGRQSILSRLRALFGRGPIAPSGAP